jgi:hypothetical protein
MHLCNTHLTILVALMLALGLLRCIATWSCAWSTASLRPVTAADRSECSRRSSVTFAVSSCCDWSMSAWICTFQVNAHILLLFAVNWKGNQASSPRHTWFRTLKRWTAMIILIEFLRSSLVPFQHPPGHLLRGLLSDLLCRTKSSEEEPAHRPSPPPEVR